MSWFDENSGFFGGSNTGVLDAPRRGDPGWYGYTDPKVTSPGTSSPLAVNQNPLFDPGTNITPGKDIPLAGTTAPTGTTATAPATTTTATGPQNGDWQTWFSSLTNGKPPTPDQLVALEPQIVAAGGKVLRNAAGIAGKIQLPGGQIVDVIQGAGTGGHAWQWLTGDASGGATGGATGGSLGSLGQGFGGMVEPFTGVFGPPTDLENQPGYKFARDQGLQAIDRSAAAKGTLLTGGNLKDLAGFAGGVASQNSNNMFNQALSTFQTNRDTFYHNQDSPFGKYLNLANLGKPTTP